MATLQGAEQAYPIDKETARLVRSFSFTKAISELKERRDFHRPPQESTSTSWRASLERAFRDFSRRRRSISTHSASALRPPTRQHTEMGLQHYRASGYESGDKRFEQVGVGEPVIVRLHRGSIDCVVEKTDQ